MHTTAAEDYVKAIYSYTEWQPEPVTPSQLATELGLAASTVTEMVKKLAAAGLVDHRPYSAITLTPAGRALALRQVRRHRLVETWLVQEHGYNWDEVHDEAEVLEHAMSDRLVEALAASLGHPTRDPHGDPIPAADGSVAPETAVLLDQLPAGHVGRVVRISDADPELLRFLAERGMRPGSSIEVVGPKKFAGALTVRTERGDLDLGPEATAAVWVSA